METIIKEAMETYVAQNSILSESQFGFWPKRSTTTNLLSCLHDWTNALKNGKHVDVAYIDFSKAFDKMSHAKLLYKLTKYGISGLGIY